MAETHLLSGGTLLCDWSGGSVIPDGAVAWREGLIVEAGPRILLEKAHPGAVRHQAHDGWIAPGLINAHHHFYSALATGLDPGMPIAGFGQRLDRMWWRLDRSHDEESIRHSVRVAALRCALSGCTTIVDHHASPAVITGVLDFLAEELEQAGLSAVLCYEASDRNSHGEAMAGLKESARFRDAVRGHTCFRGLIGLHAAFTLADRTLVQAGTLAEGGDIHVHVAEDRLDVEECLRRDGSGPLQRLHEHGLVGERSWIAHGVHLQEADLALAAESGALLVHNPESNANNQVGRLDVSRARRAGLAVGLGTDGMSPCMIAALRFAFLLHRQAGDTPEAGWDEAAGLLDGARTHVARLFGVASYGRLEPGAPADLIALDGVIGPPPDGRYLTALLCFGTPPLRVRHTVARGTFLVRDFVPCLQEAARVAAEAVPVRRALWSRFGGLAAGTPYLGSP